MLILSGDITSSYILNNAVLNWKNGMGAYMYRYRFQCNNKDPRPMTWPLKHPYWISGYGEDYAVVVAYGEDEDYIYKNWPEAKNIEADFVTEYEFTSRFPMPKWWQLTGFPYTDKSLGV